MASQPPFALKNADYSFSLERYKDFYFIHNEVYRPIPSVIRDIRGIIDYLDDIVELRVFCDFDNHKLIRYSKIFGFTPDHSAVSPTDGKLKLILTRTGTWDHYSIVDPPLAT